MRPGTFTRLCDRQKFGMVRGRTVSLSQFWGFPGTGIATKTRALRAAGKCRQGRSLRDVERPSLNFGNCGSRRTSGGPVGAASAQGAPGDDGEALAGLRGRRDERVGIRARTHPDEALSATAISKPDDADSNLNIAREHSWRPPAEGLYDLEPGKGFLRRRLHRQHQGQEVASDRLRRDQHSLQPRTSRRCRRRPARRRRRRHPGADPARLLRAQGRRDRLQAAEARRIRHRRAVHAEAKRRGAKSSRASSPNRSRTKA